LLSVWLRPWVHSELGERRQLWAFGRDSWREVKKVVWPTRKEAIQMTAYVFAFVAIMSIFLWLTDKTLEWVFSTSFWAGENND
jgi:preprotein translocase SecE subunit